MSEELLEINDSNPNWFKNLQYKDVKVFIQDNINSATRSFVVIGYYLKHIRDNELFREDGYESIWELAQDEFGISKSQASKFMSINDRFSKDGNSPILLEQYKDFSSSKLSEMLYLTDEQLEQVTPATTIVEIREIKKPEEVVSTSKQELEISEKEKHLIYCEILKEMCDCICNMDSYILEKNNYSMDTIKSLSRRDQEFSFGFGDDGAGYSKYMARCKSERYYVETFDETEKWIFEAGEVDQQIWNYNGNGWRRDRLTQEQLKQEPEKSSGQCIHRPEFPCTLPEASKLVAGNGDKCNAKCCWFCSNHSNCGYECNASAHRPVVTESVNNEPKYIETVIDEEEEETPCDRCKYDTMTADEYLKDHPGTELPCVVCDDKFSGWQPKDFEEEAKPENNLMRDPDLSCKFDPDARCLIASKESCKRNTDDECSYCSGSWGEEDYIAVEPKHEIPEGIEIVEVDIVESETIGPHNDIGKDKGIEDILRIQPTRYEDDPNCPAGMGPCKEGCNWKPSGLTADEITWICRNCWLDYLRNLISKDRDLKEPIKDVKLIQPELPILKNNDQRKEFIEAYETWPLWIDTKATEEKYYRYDFDNGSFMVVKVYFQKGYSWGELKKKDHWGSNEYYLVKTPSSHFKDCQTNMTALIEYLKEFQKKGA